MPLSAPDSLRLFAAPAPAADNSPPAGQTECAVNIGLQERRKRLRFGVVTLALGALIAAALIGTGVNHWWRLALFLPFASGAVGIFQALDKT